MNTRLNAVLAHLNDPANIKYLRMLYYLPRYYISGPTVVHGCSLPN